MNKLWLCDYGQIRSVTAALIYGGKFAGLHNRYDEKRIAQLCEWADEIFIFNNKENDNTNFFKKHFSKYAHKIKLSLEIKDQYGKIMHPHLVKKIEEKIKILNI